MANTIESELAEGNLEEAFRHLKICYHASGKVSTKPCFLSLKRQTKEHEELYWKVPSPGDSIPINVDLFDVPDEVPEDGEIRERVRELNNGCVGVTSFMLVEDLKS